ncbi:MAG: hypothetical protein HY822_16240 [Acidobacteria bacterium]|nr:hypothetical protein [Acidobacteriota bacterium]
MGRFNAAMEEFMEARGIVIDLRGNGGGMIGLAAGMSGWFFAGRSVRLGEVRMREVTLKITVQPRQRVFAGKVAILVDARRPSPPGCKTTGGQECSGSEPPGRCWRARSRSSRTATRCNMFLPTTYPRAADGWKAPE